MRFWFKDKSVGFSADICEKYRDYLFRIAFHITNDKFYAEDVVQETMCKIIRRAPKLADKTETEIKRYMTRAVINNAFTYMKQVLWETPSENIFDGAAFDVVLETILAAETKDQLMAALAQLTSKQRVVLVLIFYENWTSEEIAEEMGITDAGVRILKKRGLDNLREILLREDWNK